MKSKRNYHHLTKMKIADTLWLFLTLWKIVLSDIDDKNHRFTMDLPLICHVLPCFTIDLPLVYHGFTIDLPLVYH